jgi:hypothetical protein
MIIAALLMLLIKGWLWKIIICIFGWIGLYGYLVSNWDLDKISPFKDNFMSWAAIIPTIIVMLAMAYTRDE